MSLITTEYIRTMARYNAWQNKALRGFLQSMDEETLTEDKGAFFGSIQGTANHLLWGDLAWMARFDGGDPPDSTHARSPEKLYTLSDWERLRYRTDGRIRAWADKLQEVDLIGDLTWFSGMFNKEMTMQKTQCIVHFFNHQTHHRGQIHAMLTASGITPIDSDLIFLPEDI